MRRSDKRPSQLRTYSHLAPADPTAQRKKPSEYEIATTGLLYYPGKGGFEVQVPLSAFYEKHQRKSPLGLASDATFADPRATTYATYVAQQRDREMVVEGVLETIDKTHYDAGLSSAWLERLELVLPVLRYPGHALSMLAAYIGQMAAAGRVVVCAAMQAADEVRRVQRLTYRMVQIRKTRPGFGENARATWERDPRWQPLRELVERALVNWDANEALVALDVCIKPAFDELFGVIWAEHAKAEGDPLFVPIAGSLHDDALWHRAWSSAALRSLIGDDPARRDVARRWVGDWIPRTLDALAALEPLFAPMPFERRLRAFAREYCGSLGLGSP